MQELVTIVRKQSPDVRRQGRQPIQEQKTDTH